MLLDSVLAIRKRAPVLFFFYWKIFMYILRKVFARFPLNIAVALNAPDNTIVGISLDFQGMYKCPYEDALQQRTRLSQYLGSMRRNDLVRAVVNFQPEINRSAKNKKDLIENYDIGKAVHLLEEGIVVHGVEVVKKNSWYCKIVIRIDHVAVPRANCAHYLHISLNNEDNKVPYTAEELRTLERMLNEYIEKQTNILYFTKWIGSGGAININTYRGLGVVVANLAEPQNRKLHISF